MLFDYTNQAWTVDGIYQDCGHPVAGAAMGVNSMRPGETFPGCACYGRAHADEAVPTKIIAEMDGRERDLLKHRRSFIDSMREHGSYTDAKWDK